MKCCGDNRYHLRHLAGCVHGPECCPPSSQLDALIDREMTTLVGEVEEFLTAVST